ncbi:MAG TPA: short-chain dehydrogenase/reductase [Burkholderiales bacterium]|jgi:NAD(P)-dependent dehydrogenase (short-subunit alcohol dehydrogenase family)|nr:short-chain dehydrogenase/reductase [Burkholderiales bacterium]
MNLELQGKSVLVTGGSKGIGLACAKAFAAEGCRVSIAARDRERLEEARKLLGGKAKTHPVDLRDGKALRTLAAACADVDILVNNAGDIPGGTIEAVDEAKWRHAWELKVFGYVNLTRELFARMKARGSGVIVNVIGMAGEYPSFEYVCGSTANAGLGAFTKAMGKGSAAFGVRVLGVHPPATRTDRIVPLIKAAAKEKLGDENRWQELVGTGSFGQMIEPEQVADMVAFLASVRAGKLSGVMVNLGA